MKKYRAYSDLSGSDQIIVKAENIKEAKKIAKSKMVSPDNMKIYCQTIEK